MVQWYSMSRWCFLLGIQINSVFSLCTPGKVWGMFTLLVVGVGIWSGKFEALSRQKMVEWLQTVTTNNDYNRESSNGLEWQVLWSSGHVTHSNTNWNITQNHINVMTSTGMVLSLVRNSLKAAQYDQMTSKMSGCVFVESPVYPIEQILKRKLVARFMP